MSRGQRILHQIQGNQQEIAKLIDDGVTAGEQSRLQMLLRSQNYLAAEYRKATGQKVPGAPAKPPQPARPNRSVTVLSPNCVRQVQEIREGVRDRKALAVVVSLSGDVQVKGFGDWLPASAGELLSEGTKIRTRNGTAVVRFESESGKAGKTVSLSPNSLLIIYHSRKSKQTRRNPCLSTEIDSKELQEALRALRGKTATPDS